MITAAGYDSLFLTTNNMVKYHEKIVFQYRQTEFKSLPVKNFNSPAAV